MGIILVPNSSEANLANGPANNRWKYGLGTLLFGWGGQIKGQVAVSDIVLILGLNQRDNTRHYGDNTSAQWTSPDSEPPVPWQSVKL